MTGGLTNGLVADALLAGTLGTPFGSIDFDLNELDGSTAGTGLQACTQTGGCGLGMPLFFDSLDQVAIDRRETNTINGFGMDSPFVANIGEIGSVKRPETSAQGAVSAPGPSPDSPAASAA